MAGRPREFDRDEALRRVREVFWARGYEGVSMSDLVAATGLASARIYAAFGSKQALFREAVDLYERHEGGFADHALAEQPTARGALQRMLRDAVEVYTRPEPRGCMVVSAATNCSPANDSIRGWLEERRRRRTESIIARVREAVDTGELASDTDPEALGDLFATLLHGLSTQARDGIPRQRLLALIRPAMTLLDRAASDPAARSPA